MQNNEAEELLNRYRNGTASPKETDQLLHWVQDLEIEEEVSFSEAELELVSAKMWQRINKQSSKPKAVRLWPRIAAAASIVLCLGLGAYLLRNKKSADQQTVQKQPDDIAPGTEKAILKFGNGHTIILDNTGKGLIAEQGNTSIHKTTGGEVVYSTSSGTANKMVYDTIQIPAGGKTYHLQLADGSKVILNAATKLRFPENFTGDERKVDLIVGEAYFEVVHNAQTPFRVSTHGHVIEDIGTHFNVNAYDDEPAEITTLLEGSVKVTAHQQSAILKPGQQSLIKNGNAAIVIKDADTEKAVAWKDGLFMFDDENLAAIMRQISRWYNVEVVFEDAGLQNKLFSGSVSRFSNASQVLSKLALTGSVHFKITGRRILVTK
jgi:transmembrane sensor